MTYELTKRTIDLFGSTVLLVLGAPVLAGTAIVVRLVLGRPILFRQRRTGRAGEVFTLYKFRSMREARDSAGRILPDSERLSPFGYFLRSTSLDELPELLNVFHGDMSLVGPRPLLPEYLDRYSPHQMRRHEVKPGITGWAQVNGRNDLSWQEKFDLDVWYVDHRSVLLDLKILALTVVQVLRGNGVHHPGHSTAPEFRGNPATGS